MIGYYVSYIDLAMVPRQIVAVCQHRTPLPHSPHLHTRCFAMSSEAWCVAALGATLPMAVPTWRQREYLSPWRSGIAVRWRYLARLSLIAGWNAVLQPVMMM